MKPYRSYLVVPVIIAIFILGFLVFCVTYGKDGGELIRYRELLPIIGVLVTIIAIVVSLFAGLGYFLLDRLLEERITKFIDEKSEDWSNKSNIRTYILIGFTYWRLAKLDPAMLDFAIRN